MKLVLKDGSQIELAMGNNQSQFVINYGSDAELLALEVLLTQENLSDAHYEINGTITDTLKNKVISGSNRNLISQKVTYYLTDANNAEIERLKATVAMQEETITELQEQALMLTDCILEMSEIVYADNTGEEETE